MKTIYTNSTMDGLFNNLMLLLQNNPIETFIGATIALMSFCYFLTLKG